MRRTILSAIALGMVLASVSTAQIRPSITAGSRIRLKTKDTTRVLLLVDRTTDSVVVRQTADAAPETLPLSQVRRLEISGGMRTPGQGARRGFGYGLLVGGGAGVMMGLADGDDEGTFLAFSAEEKAMAFGAVLGGLGGMIGAFVGAYSPGEQWYRVPTANARVSVVPQPSGRLALTIGHRW